MRTENAALDLRSHPMEEEERPTLSAGTLAALHDFLAERQQQQGQEGDEGVFAEDWGKSQFWYTEDTSRRVAKAIAAALAGVEGAGLGKGVACLACPTLFRGLRGECRCHLFEFDKKFAVVDNFSHYDYREPEAVPDELRGAFAVVALDPPYLSEECLGLSAQTVRLLRAASSTPVVLLTGAVMRGAAERLLGLRPVAFRPQHRNKLGNEFLLYTNSEAVAEACGGWDPGD